MISRIIFILLTWPATSAGKQRSDTPQHRVMVPATKS
jgi:hypothetical protein